ncbi:branched-chain amino acid ABC transporter permease [Dactylosporangium fulvum]|uniref:branched-chain amino acid ABC transporter permease n=1 Tax=Dactylosporangium fulvum TaxID=53359 RepID=UPI0031E0799C
MIPTVCAPPARSAAAMTAVPLRLRWYPYAGKGVLAAAMAGGIALPWIADAYTVSLAATAVVLAVLAMSTQLLVGVAGLPSFGQAAYFGVGAYTTALLARAGITDGPVQLLAATLAGAVAAAVTAPLVLRTRGTALLMTTFAVQSLTATAASQWTALTGGDDGLHTPPVSLPVAGALTRAAAVYWWVLGCLLLAGAVTALVLRSRLGLVLRGCAGHEPRLAALGHPVQAELAAGYTVAGALAGAAGAMLVAVNRYISPADMGFDVAAVTFLAAAIGAGTMTAAVAGAAAVVAARDLFGGMTGGHGHALLGALFLTVAYARPAVRSVVARRRDRAGGDGIPAIPAAVDGDVAAEGRS